MATKRSVVAGSKGVGGPIRTGKGDLQITPVYKGGSAYYSTGPYYRGKNDLRSQFAGEGSYIGGAGGVYARPTAKPYRPMPAPTGVEAVVRPGVPAGKVQVISNVVREKTSPVPRARPASAPAPARRGVAPGTGGRMTKAQRDAPAGPRGGGGGRVGTRTGGVAAGTGGRMTKSQRESVAGPRGSRM